MGQLVTADKIKIIKEEFQQGNKFNKLLTNNLQYEPSHWSVIKEYQKHIIYLPTFNETFSSHFIVRR